MPFSRFATANIWKEMEMTSLWRCLHLILRRCQVKSDDASAIYIASPLSWSLSFHSFRWFTSKWSERIVVMPADIITIIMLYVKMACSRCCEEVINDAILRACKCYYYSAFVPIGNKSIIPIITIVSDSKTFVKVTLSRRTFHLREKIYISKQN